VHLYHVPFVNDTDGTGLILSRLQLRHMAYVYYINDKSHIFVGFPVCIAYNLTLK